MSPKTPRLASLILAIAAVAIVSHPVSDELSAASIVWDGTTDDNWTNGPQNNSTGSVFPANGATGSNWTIDGGTAGQLAVPDAGTPPKGLINYFYSGHDWTIDSAMIEEDIAIRLDGGSLTVTNSIVLLLPSSATTTAKVSGLNLGHGGTFTTATLTNSTLIVSRANQNGNALQVLEGSFDLSGSEVVVDSELGHGVLNLRGASTMSVTSGSDVLVTRDFRINDTATLNIDSTSTVNIVEGLEVLSENVVVTLDGGAVDTGFIQLNSGSSNPQSLMFNFAGGAITLNDQNPLRDDSGFEGAFDWTGGPGSGTVTHTNLTDFQGRTLAFEVSQGFFSINGIRVHPNNETGDVALLNAELAMAPNIVDGTFFQVLEGDTTQTLVLLAVPEPSSLGLMVLAGVGLVANVLRRR